MRTLTHREKRTVQIGALVVVACFVILGVTKGAKYFGKRRGDYRQLVLEAQELKREVGIHQARAAAALCPLPSALCPKRSAQSLPR